MFHKPLPLINVPLVGLSWNLLAIATERSLSFSLLNNTSSGHRPTFMTHPQTNCVIAGPVHITYTPPPPVHIIAVAAAAADTLLAAIYMLTAIYILFCLFIFLSFGTHLSCHSSFVAQPLFTALSPLAACSQLFLHFNNSALPSQLLLHALLTSNPLLSVRYFLHVHAKFFVFHEHASIYHTVRLQGQNM